MKMAGGTSAARGKRKAQDEDAHPIAGPFKEMPFWRRIRDVVIPYKVSIDEQFLSQPGNMNPSAWRRVVRFRGYPTVQLVVSPDEVDAYGRRKLNFSILGLSNVSAVVSYTKDKHWGGMKEGNTISIKAGLGDVTIVWRGMLPLQEQDDPAPKPLISLLRNEASIKRADVVLVTKNGVQRAHSDVLVQESEFFRVRIERWSEGGEVRIDVDLSEEACTLLLECIYGGFHECFIKGLGATLDWASPAVKELATFADYTNDTDLMGSLLRAVPMTTLAAAMSVLEWEFPSGVDVFNGLTERARIMVKQAAQESMDDPDMDDSELLTISKEIFAAKKRRLSYVGSSGQSNGFHKFGKAPTIV
ncbi:hypothetical protein KFL_004150040 [Klebsormidium nitens]|uniref:BTB domain-containing protein n=1 Tax=Klebsormidium nitens TaxID=105231 RepID=A0A1Y1IBI3_KLENI|nr:hypothetical protein KFL_004150040 [Klebsormidium nitens]|eukprot:GAQ88280.1 hypothetical protein KFL_004150040 [Klebsormidium nitens]